jgi:hypothetical protein
VRGDTTGTIYLMSGEDFTVTEIISSAQGLSVLAITDNALYYAKDRQIIYRYDIATGHAEEIMSFEQPVAFERNADLSCFAINAGDNEQAQVYDAATGELSVAEDVFGGLLFYRNSVNVLTDGENFFTATLEAISEPSDVIMFAERAALSELFSVFEITEQSVRILLS